MSNRSIVFTAPCIAELIEVDMPTIAENEVLLETVITTISPGTERANLIGDPNVQGRNAPNVTFPRRMGYSAGAVVRAVGEKVTRVKVGDRVAASWTKHAQFNKVPERQAYLLPDSVSFEEASLIHIATFPLAAIRKCKLEMGESAIVMGQGVLGMIAVKLLRLAGAAPIIAVDPVAEKREIALRYGADYALDPFEEGFADRVKKLTGGGARVCIEVTGKGQGMDMALDCMAKYGRMALLGCTRNSDFSIDYYRKVHCTGVTLIGAHTMARPKQESHEGWWTELDDAEALLCMIDLGRLELKDMIEETRSPEEAFEVFDRLAKNPAFPVVQFDWRKLK